MKVIYLAVVLAVVSATYSSSSEEDFYNVNNDEIKMEHTESDLDNAADNVHLVYQHQSNPARKINRGPPYPNTYFAAYREKVMSSEMQPNSDYLSDVPKQSAYNPIRYSTYFQQQIAKQDDYVVGVSHSS